MYGSVLSRSRCQRCSDTVNVTFALTHPALHRGWKPLRVLCICNNPPGSHTHREGLREGRRVVYLGLEKDL